MRRRRGRGEEAEGGGEKKRSEKENKTEKKERAEEGRRTRKVNMINRKFEKNTFNMHGDNQTQERKRT